MSAPDPLHDPFASLLGYQLRRLSLVVMSDLTEALQPLGLRPAEGTVLMAVEANPGITQSEIGRMLGIKRANMAPLIAGLEGRGLIGRQPMNGRSQALTLTAEGESMAAEALRRSQANEARCFPNIPPEERLRLAEQLRRVWSIADAGE